MAGLDLKNLAARVRREGCGNYHATRDLRSAIAPALGWTWEPDPEPDMEGEGEWRGPRGSRGALPNWTGDLDSAVTLARQHVGDFRALTLMKQATSAVRHISQLPTEITARVIEHIASPAQGVPR